MFPLRDTNPTELTPYVTFLLIGANLVTRVGGFVAGVILIKPFERPRAR